MKNKYTTEEAGGKQRKGVEEHGENQLVSFNEYDKKDDLDVHDEKNFKNKDIWLLNLLIKNSKKKNY